MNNQSISIRGTCGQCRHANHGTSDAAEGLWACPWLGATSPTALCRIVYVESGDYVFSPLDGNNCTWGTGDPLYRAVPAGYKNKAVRAADCSEDQVLLPVRWRFWGRHCRLFWAVWNYLRRLV